MISTFDRVENIAGREDVTGIFSISGKFFWRSLFQGR